MFLKVCHLCLSLLHLTLVALQRLLAVLLCDVLLEFEDVSQFDGLSVVLGKNLGVHLLEFAQGNHPVNLSLRFIIDRVDQVFNCVLVLLH